MGMDINVSGDLLAVSRLKQADVVTPAALDALILFNESSGINVQEDRKSNESEKDGEVEPTDVDVFDRTSSGTLAQDEASPDGLAWMFAYLFGNHAVSIPVGSVRLHTSKMLTYPVNPAYFTVAHRRGGSSVGSAAAEFRRHYGLGINSLDLTFAKNEFLKSSAGVLGVGKYDNSVVTETFTVNFDSTPTCTLTNDPVGATDADRASGVTAWADMDSDGTFETPVAVVSYVASTNVLTLTDVGAGSRPVRVSYNVVNTATNYTWSNLGSLQVQDEFKLKAGNIQLRLGGKYTEPGGVPTFTGGQVVGCEIDQLVYKGDWNGKTSACWRIGNTEDPTATAVELGDMIQTISVNRQVRDYMLAQNWDANTAFSLYIDALGPVIEGSERFSVKVFFPKVKLLKRDMKVTDKKWAEAGDLVVLKDTVNGWATAITQVQNQVASYLA